MTEYQPTQSLEQGPSSYDVVQSRLHEVVEAAQASLQQNPDLAATVHYTPAANVSVLGEHPKLVQDTAHGLLLEPSDDPLVTAADHKSGSYKVYHDERSLSYLVNHEGVFAVRSLFHSTTADGDPHTSAYSLQKLNVEGVTDWSSLDLLSRLVDRASDRMETITNRNRSELVTTA